MKKLLTLALATALVVSSAAFVANAEDEENVYYVEQDANGSGTEDDPFGTIDEAIWELDGKDGTVYVYGTYDITGFKAPAWEGMVTIKGATKDSCLHVTHNVGVIFNGAVTFKDIAFDIEEYAHFNPNGFPMIFDAGDDAEFGYMFHLTAFMNAIVDEAYFELDSGSISTVHACGGYSTSYANGCMGDSTIVINGGTAKSINLSADKYMDTQTGISIGGNMNLIYNGGTIGAIGNNNATKPEIMGALNIIFNNGMEAPEKFGYPEDAAAAGVFIIKSAKGGKVMPTADPGVFEITADKGNVAVINGEQVFNGTVELEAGETEVTWTAGEQPEAEKIEIKLTIGKAEIVKNGEAKALDVPAQIIDSRTMVPLRAIFEALGASVEWDDATKTVTSNKGDTTVKLTIGTPAITVNGADKALDVPAQIVDSRTLVPVRAIAEAYGCEVSWDDATKTVTIVG